jgi:lipid A ethanolaminephosphotransferase
VRTLQTVGEDAQLGASYAQQARPPLLVLVVGETARAQNWGLSGYARPTTPALARWQAQGDLVNFPEVQSCGTNTQVSVPCMFSPLTREQGGDKTAYTRTCWTCCNAPAWRCCGWTTSRAARACAPACPT